MPTEFVPCNLCGGSICRPHLKKFGQTIVNCRRCGLLFTNPRPQEEDLFKRYGPDYFLQEYLPAFGAGTESYSLDIVMNRYSLYLDVLEHARLSGRRLLDVGAGAGFFVKAASQNGWEAEGVEVSETAAAYGRDILKVRLHNRKFEETDFGEATFDAVTLLDTIEHLRDPLGCLSGIRRILKKNGLLILNTPDVRSLSRLFLGRDWAEFSPVEHLYYFSQKTLAAILQKAWFRLLGVRNLLRFNPEYTHDKESARYRRWKKWHEDWEKKPLRLKIHEYEQKDVLRIVEDHGRTRARSGAQTFLSVRILVNRIAFAAAKSFLRGDLLIGLARKE